jgi:hypothetical protein
MMQRLIPFLTFSGVLLLSACTGIDLVDLPEVGEKLSIVPRIDSLAVGEERFLSVIYSNQYGIEEDADDIFWYSSDPAKITIDATGRAEGVALGETTLYATNGRVTDSLVLNLAPGTDGNNSDTTFLKMGTFQRISNSYNIAGEVRVQTVGGITQIITDPGFSVSAGPSLYLLLANHTMGSYTVTPNGSAVNAVSAQITPNRLSNFSGMLTWTLPPNVDPSAYSHVVFYCTLGPVFGAAELN